MKTELWLTEGLRIRALCRDPAELLAALCSADIGVSDLRESGSQEYTFLIPAAAEERLMKLSGRCGAELSVISRHGFFHFLRRFRRRAYLLLIPIPFLLFFLFLSTRLWEIDVQGNTSLTRAEILSALETVGVYPGVSGLRLDNPRIRSMMLAKLDKLIWCTVQVSGSRAVVQVRERRQPPKLVDEELAREVAAAKSGTIETLQVLEGKALVRRGDTVLQGETLITGRLTDRQGEARQVHALGRVFALTWYEKSMELPLTVMEKSAFGETETRYGLKIGDYHLFFHNDSSICQENYDKIYFEHRLTAFGLSLPISLLRAECRAYRLSEYEIPPEEAAALLEERLLDWLRLTVPEAELLDAQFSREESDGRIRVTMLAQCREDIGMERELGP